MTSTTVESNVASEIQHKNKVHDIVDMDRGVTKFRCFFFFQIRLYTRFLDHILIAFSELNTLNKV